MYRDADSICSVCGWFTVVSGLTVSAFALQVNFYQDHTKVILCSLNQEHLLTYINGERVSTSYSLGTLLASGCPDELRHRLDYALNMLLQKANWEGTL